MSQTQTRSLASMLMPALSGARKQAKWVKCKGNLRQVSIGVLTYADDYDDGTPPHYSASTGSATYSGHYMHRPSPLRQNVSIRNRTSARTSSGVPQGITCCTSMPENTVICPPYSRAIAASSIAYF